MNPVRFSNLGQTSALAGLVLLVLIGGCASAGSSGRLTFDDEVTRMFTGNAVPPEYRYYTVGRSDMPYAIVGIAPEYQLVTRWWDPVTPNTAVFKSKVDFIWEPHVWYQVTPAQGAWILNPAGEKIGIWYSMYASTAIGVNAQRKVQIYSPDLEK